MAPAINRLVEQGLVNIELRWTRNGFRQVIECGPRLFAEAIDLLTCEDAKDEFHLLTLHIERPDEDEDEDEEQ